MAAVRSVANLLLAVLCCCDFATSGILQSPIAPPQFKGYQSTYQNIKKQSYDPRTGVVGKAFSVTSRQCNVIRRRTSYERARVPFLCSPQGQMLPMPKRMDKEKMQVLAAMKAGGWSMCTKTVSMPVYTFHRIPVCCPGTIPTHNGGCIPASAAQSNVYMANPGRPTQEMPTPVIVQAPRPLRQLIGGRMPMPTNNMMPGGLMQQVLMNRNRAGPSYTTDSGLMSPLPYSYPTPPYAMPGPQGGPGSPDWQDDMARYLISVMYQQLLAERQQQMLQDEIERQLRIMIITQQRRLAEQQLRQMIIAHVNGLASGNNNNNNINNNLPSGGDDSANNPSYGTEPPPYGSITPPFGNDATTYAPETDTHGNVDNVDDAPQFVLPQGTTPLPTSDIDSLLHGDSSGPGILDSNPDLGLPHDTTPNPDVIEPPQFPPPQQGMPGMGGMPGGMNGGMGGMQGGMPGGMNGGMGGMQGGMPGGMNGGMGGGMPGGMGGMHGGMPGGPGGMGGAPGGMPQLPPGVTKEMVIAEQEKVKVMVEDCLKESGITNSMETIVRSGDVNMMRPVCMASETIGPCVMTKAKATIGQDQIGMIGREMVQGAMMSLGGICNQLQKSGQLGDAPPGGHASHPMPPGPGMMPPTPGMMPINPGMMSPPTGMTSPPVFPNSPPSLKKEPVTEVVEAPVTATQGSNLKSAPAPSKTEPAAGSTQGVVGSGPTPANSNDAPAVKPPAPSKDAAAGEAHAHMGDHQDAVPVTTDEDREGEGEFPMWIILTMVGAVAGLLIITCVTVCCVLRCRRRRKEVELDREPEKLPVPVEANIYAATPRVPPPAYQTTAVPQTLQIDDDLSKDFHIPEDVPVEEKKEQKK